MPNRINLPRWIPAAGAAVVLVAAGGVAYGAASQPDTVACTTSPCTVTVTFPAPTTATVTQTVTSTVTQTVTAAPTSSSPTSSTTTTTPPPATTTTTAPPAGCPVAGANKPGASDGKGGCFPGPGTAGVPAGVTLTAYSGSLTISTDNTVIDGKTFGGRVKITGKNVTITRSRMPYGLNTTGANATVSDSYIASGDGSDKAADLNGTTLIRSEVDGKGGNSAGWCSNCVIRDSWLHISTRRNATDHNSGYRMRQNGTFTHNTISCEVPSTSQDGGCSAALTGYGDFEQVRDNLLTGNLFVASTQQSFCSYGGSSAGKPFGPSANVRFVGNVFQRGSNRECGAYAPIGDFVITASNGNAMSGNVWDDGAAVTASDVN